MSRTRTIWPAALVLAALCPLPATAQATPPLSSVVDGVAAELMAKQHVPGAAIAVVKHGAIAYEHAYGYADVAGRVPVTVDTRFEIGSVTKQFTAACIMQQIRAGALALDDPLGKFIPEYPAAASVTIRQLLSHTSGIPEYAIFGQTNPSTFAPIVELVAKKPLLFPPGSKWSYSNTNYILLGRILELTAHEPYERYVREHIFEPAHMTQSGFMADERALPGMATGYQQAGVVGFAFATRDAAGADGSIVSTVGDVAKWNHALASGAIVPLADVALMQTPVRVNDGSPRPYGFGFAVDTFGGHPRISHEGRSNGFTATNAIFPRDDESIIILQNLAEASPERISSAIFSAEHPDVTATFNTAVPGENKAITARLREVLRRAASGQPDRAQFSQRFNDDVLTPDGIAFAKDELGPLGPATRFVFRGKTARPASPGNPATTVYKYNVAYGTDQEGVVLAIDARNKVDGFGFGRYSDSAAPAKPDAAAKEDPAVTARLQDFLRRLASGDFDRTLLTTSFSNFISPSMAADSKKQFAALGPPKAFVFRGASDRGGTTFATYDVVYAAERMSVQIAVDAQGKISALAYGRPR